MKGIALGSGFDGTRALWAAAGMGWPFVQCVRVRMCVHLQVTQRPYVQPAQSKAAQGAVVHFNVMIWKMLVLCSSVLGCAAASSCGCVPVNIHQLVVGNCVCNDPHMFVSAWIHVLLGDEWIAVDVAFCRCALCSFFLLSQGVHSPPTPHTVARNHQSHCSGLFLPCRDLDFVVSAHCFDGTHTYCVCCRRGGSC